MTENERIRMVRKAKSLTLEKFGEKVGVTRGAVSAIENGLRGVTDQMRRSICREFSISETWLRTGDGDMYEPQPTDLLDALTVEYGFSEKERRVAEMFLTLDVNRRRAALEYISDVVDALNGEDADSGEGNHQEENVPEMTLEELHAELDRQWALEKGRGEESEASGSGSSGMVSA